MEDFTLVPPDISYIYRYMYNLKRILEEIKLGVYSEEEVLALKEYFPTLEEMIKIVIVLKKFLHFNYI